MDTQKGHPDTERRKWLWGVLPKPFGAALGPPKERGAMTGKPIRPIMKLVGIVALGALVIAGTALHFAPGPTGESSSPSSSEKTIADSRFTDIDAVDDYLSVDDLLKHVYTEEPDQGTMASPSSKGTAQEIQVLPEDDPYAHLTIDEFTRRLEQDKVADPSASTANIGVLPEDDPYAYLTLEEFDRAVASKKAGYNHETQRLERQIDRLLADAARDPSRNTPLLNRQIERLDYQIDMLRLNAMQNQSADRPLSSEASGTWPPDTKYYLDPDYREHQVAK
jgi:hypothetical protein